MAEIQWSTHRNVNLPKGFGQESGGPASERHTVDRVDSKHIPSASWLFEEDAINLKPQEKERNTIRLHFSEIAS